MLSTSSFSLLRRSNSSNSAHRRKASALLKFLSVPLALYMSAGLRPIIPFSIACLTSSNRRSSVALFFIAKILCHASSIVSLLCRRLAAALLRLLSSLGRGLLSLMFLPIASHPLVVDIHTPIIIANNLDISVCPLVKARLVAKILFAILVPIQIVVIMLRTAIVTFYERLFMQFRRLKPVHLRRLLLCGKFGVFLQHGNHRRRRHIRINRRQNSSRLCLYVLARR